MIEIIFNTIDYWKGLNVMEEFEQPSQARKNTQVILRWFIWVKSGHLLSAD